MRLNVVVYFYFEVIMMDLIEIFKQHCLACNTSEGYLHINGTKFPLEGFNSYEMATKYIQNILKAVEASDFILRLAKHIESDLIDVGVAVGGDIRIDTKFFPPDTFSYAEQEFLRCFTTRYETRQKQRVKEADRLTILNMLK